MLLFCIQPGRDSLGSGAIHIRGGLPFSTHLETRLQRSPEMFLLGDSSPYQVTIHINHHSKQLSRKFFRSDTRVQTPFFYIYESIITSSPLILPGSVASMTRGWWWSVSWGTTNGSMFFTVSAQAKAASCLGQHRICCPSGPAGMGSTADCPEESWEKAKHVLHRNSASQ